DFSGVSQGVTLLSSVTLESDAFHSGSGGAVNLAANARDAGKQALTIAARARTGTLGQIGNPLPLGGPLIVRAAVTLNGNVTTDQGTGTGAGTGDLTLGASLIDLGADVTISSDANKDGTSGVVYASATIRSLTGGQRGMTIIAGDGDGTTGITL